MHTIPVSLCQTCNSVRQTREKQTYTATVARPEMCVYPCLVLKNILLYLYSVFLGIKKTESGGISGYYE